MFVQTALTNSDGSTVLRTPHGEPMAVSKKWPRD
jgi:hypothetical protein